MTETRACLLFDIDGTLVDTDKVHIVAYNETLKPFGIEVDEHFYLNNISGRTNPVILAELLPDLSHDQHQQLSLEKEALFRAMSGVMEPISGLIELLDWADHHKIPYAAVTHAPRKNAELVLRALNAWHRFETVVIAEELDHAKPHPLPYLTGLKKLNGDAARTVAFEDSRTGVASANTAGLAVIGLTTSLSADSLVEAGATLAAPDYRDLRLLDFVRTKLGVT
jgi:beta-phosphoglucomutase-like phosphatase (HAD superfamily)